MKTVVLALFALLSTTGCWVLFPHEEEPPAIEPMPDPRTPSLQNAPTISNIRVPTFPPLGKADAVVVDCAAPNANLSRLSARFRNTQSVPISGSHAQVELTGEMLGEGFGTLTLQVTNTANVSATRAVERLLVDLTPPELIADTTVARPSGELMFWVQDAWVLGSVELTFGGKTLRHEFPKAYPSTLGTSWDQSRVAFPAEGLPEGRGEAYVIATDAAGNAQGFSVDVAVDGTPPRLSMTAPFAGQVVGDTFDVTVEAADVRDNTPVQVQVYVNESLVGTVLGPRGTLQVDTAALPRGPLEVTTIAFDEAGNASVPRSVQVIVE